VAPLPLIIRALGRLTVAWTIHVDERFNNVISLACILLRWARSFSIWSVLLKLYQNTVNVAANPVERSRILSDPGVSICSFTNLSVIVL